MADEPTPPPKTEQEATDDEEEYYPFIDVTAAGDLRVHITAGWAVVGGERVESTAVDVVAGAGSVTASSAYEAALEWYRDAVGEILAGEEAEP